MIQTVIKMIILELCFLDIVIHNENITVRQEMLNKRKKSSVRDLQLVLLIFFLNTLMTATEEFLMKLSCERVLSKSLPAPHRARHPINLFILESFTCAVNHDCRQTTNTRFVFERS